MAESFFADLTPKGIKIVYNIIKSIINFSNYKDWGMNNFSAFLMVAIDIGVSLLPGRSADEVLGVLYEALRRYGQITAETIKAAAEITLTSDKQNDNPNPGRIPCGGSFTNNVVGGGASATNKNIVAIFH